MFRDAEETGTPVRKSRRQRKQSTRYDEEYGTRGGRLQEETQPVSQPQSSVPAAARGQPEAALSFSPPQFSSQPPVLPDPPSAQSLALSAASAATRDDNPFILPRSAGSSPFSPLTARFSASSTASSSSSSPAVPYTSAQYYSAESSQSSLSAADRGQRQRIRRQKHQQQKTDDPPSELSLGSLDPDYEEPDCSSLSSDSSSDDSESDSADSRRKGRKRRKPRKKKKTVTARQRASAQQRDLQQEPELTDEHKQALFELRWGVDNREQWLVTTTLALNHAWRLCIAAMDEQFGVTWSKKKLADACDNAHRVWRDRETRALRSGRGSNKFWVHQEQMDRYHAATFNVRRDHGSHAGAAPLDDSNQQQQQQSASQSDSVSEVRSVADEQSNNVSLTQSHRRRSNGIAAAIAEAQSRQETREDKNNADQAARADKQAARLDRINDTLSAIAQLLAQQTAASLQQQNSSQQQSNSRNAD